MEMDITGNTSREIAASVRALVDTGALAPDEVLPPVRILASRLGVNRNTVAAAYRQLTQAGVTSARRRAGTRIARRGSLIEEGFSSSVGRLRDIGSGNPDPMLLPDSAAACIALDGPPVLYGESAIDLSLVQWATNFFVADAPGNFRVTVTGGAVDAIERLLAQSLTHGDAVALEDPCFLASIHIAKHAGYRALPVPVDEHGMTVAGLRAALSAGARAVVCTPRAHNPTGVSLTGSRATELRQVLAAHPHVLVIEDDHFSMLSRSRYHSIIGSTRLRWALVRSVSKFLVPDLRLAFTASDSDTAAGLATRLSGGTTWVSHILQRIVHHMLTDPHRQQDIAQAGRHYVERNASFAALLTSHGLAACHGDGLNLWVNVQADGTGITRRLKQRGWLARAGADFALAAGTASTNYLRLTVHDLDDTARHTLAADLAATALTSVIKTAGATHARPSVDLKGPEQARTGG